MSQSALLLPSTYYHDHFSEMVEFILSIYGSFLKEDDHEFIRDFKNLGHDAQCLYIRMANRKKSIFCMEDLNYQEIQNHHKGLAELFEKRFIRSVCEEDYWTCLSSLAKFHFVDIAKTRLVENFKSSWPKNKMVSFFYEALPYQDFESSFQAEKYFLPLRKDKIGFLLYLYFGKLQPNLISFALRDLGIVSVHARENYKARFKDMAEAEAGFFYSQALNYLKKAENAVFENMAADIGNFPPAQTDFVFALRDELLFTLGRFFEKQKEFLKAAQIYRHSLSFDSRERLIRILQTDGQHEEARAMLDQILQSPSDDEEYIFAVDFYERKYGQKRTGVFTDILRNTEILEADDSYRGYPEYAAIKHFEARGWTCNHTENGLWPTLFGLLFWDELFESEDAFNCGFDFVPHALKDKSFYERYQGAIQKKLEAVMSGQAMEIARTTIEKHLDFENGIFSWFDDMEDFIEQFVTSSPPQALSIVLDKMAQDFYAYRSGFPDLMMTKDGCIKFMEVKGEGDCIRRNQLSRLNLLRSAGFDADICRVQFKVDPQQSYVVIDVETTGGRPPYDRITEIGAVKIRNEQVVEIWQSLINPERRIPGMITQLTGITNDMVQDAPIFADIADELEAFMDGSVFVAHNVNFDHGFISSEYRRLERHFRYPKLCTCASMRKYYPGHNSYGLANLCREYGIDLKNHHRALADAQAAAELLNLVNQKRLAA